ncbi:MAG: hypothetical protein ABR905_02940 [Terracidiphilus sp.]|jgi:hypothetical protein
MHIHGNSMAVNTANLYSAAQAERADSAKRAAEVRKRLLKGASEIEGAATPVESLLIGRWLDAGHSQNQNDDEYHSSSAGRDSDFG